MCLIRETNLQGSRVLQDRFEIPCHSLSFGHHDHGLLAECLMHIAYKIGNSSGVSGDVCVTFFDVPHGNKDAVIPNPLMEEESFCVCNCDNECLRGSTKTLFSK